MALIERLMGVDAATHGSKVPVHAFSATLRERARGRLDNPSITSAGNATAQLARATLIDDVLLLAEAAAPEYDTPAKVRGKLGL